MGRPSATVNVPKDRVDGTVGLLGSGLSKRSCASVFIFVPACCAESCTAKFRKCPGKDSNLHAFKGRRILSPLRLPFRHPGGLRTSINSVTTVACKKNRRVSTGKIRPTKKALPWERL